MTIAVTLKPQTLVRLREGAAHIVITGATGWLGRALTHALHEACAGRLHLFASKAGETVLADGTVLPTEPLSALGALPREHEYYVFHLAFLTKDKESAMMLEEYTEKNRAICVAVGAMTASHKVAGLCVTSSGAVYKSPGEELNRDRIKYPYAALKVEDEEYFRNLCKACNIPLLIPRIFNMSGPYINKWHAYALASLLQMAMNGEKLAIAARHPVIRSYVAVQDIVQLLTCWLMREDARGELTFDVSAPEEIEIGALAGKICAATGRDTADITRALDPALPADRYLGDSRVFLRLCDTFCIAPLTLDAQIRGTMEYMQKTSS